MRPERDLRVVASVVRAATLPYPVTVIARSLPCLTAVVHPLLEHCAFAIEVCRISDVFLIVLALLSTKMHVNQ